MQVNSLYLGLLVHIYSYTENTPSWKTHLIADSD